MGIAKINCQQLDKMGLDKSVELIWDLAINTEEKCRNVFILILIS